MVHRDLPVVSNETTELEPKGVHELRHPLFPSSPNPYICKGSASLTSEAKLGDATSLCRAIPPERCGVSEGCDLKSDPLRGCNPKFRTKMFNSDTVLFEPPASSSVWLKRDAHSASALARVSNATKRVSEFVDTLRCQVQASALHLSTVQNWTVA